MILDVKDVKVNYIGINLLSCRRRASWDFALQHAPGWEGNRCSLRAKRRIQRSSTTRARRYPGSERPKTSRYSENI